MGRVLLLAATVFAVVTSTALAQQAELRGRVLEAGPSSPLPGASIELASDGGTHRASTSDETGRFLLRGIRPGRYVLTIRFVGFKAVTDTLQFDFDEVQERTYRLLPEPASMNEVLVEEDRFVDRRRAGMSIILPSALARVPMADVSYDLAGYLLTQPGFVSTADRGGQLFVRGGTPTQNLVLIDGIPLYQPFHIVGFYSAFPADIVSYADVYAGGFGARYGGRISSVIDVSTINGDKTRLRGAVSVAPFLNSLRLEGPLVAGKVSMVASARTSVIDRVAPTLLGQDLPYRFGDLFVKLHAFLNQTSALSVTAIQTFDEGDLGSGSEGNRRPSSWQNQAIGARYSYIPSDYPALFEFATHYSRLSSRYRPAPDDQQDAGVSGYTMEMRLSYLLGQTQVHGGLFGNLHLFDYVLGPRQEQVRSGVSSGGLFFDTRFQLGPSFRIEPGVRIETFSRGIATTIGPRVRLTVQPGGDGGRQQWFAAWGRYFQQIIGLNNEQDVSDVFTIWEASARNAAVPAATHVILGWRGRPTPWLEVTLEGYRKQLEHLAFPIIDPDPNAFAGYARVDGTAEGMDARIEMQAHGMRLSTGYSLARVRYAWSAEGGAILNGVIPSASGGGRFSPPHDRRHQVNILANVRRGRYRVSVAWQFGSGLPFTQINGYYSRLHPSEREPSGHLTALGRPTISRNSAYTARLPAYHRLDVSIDRTIQLKQAVVTVQAGLVNAYDRGNILEYNFFSGERVNQLPVIPSIGLKVALR